MAKESRSEKVVQAIRQKTRRRFPSSWVAPPIVDSFQGLGLHLQDQRDLEGRARTTSQHCDRSVTHNASGEVRFQSNCP